MRLSSRAYLETAPQERPHLKLAWLEGETDGLIALTGGPNGPLDLAFAGGQNALALTRCEALQRLYGDRLYVELQRHGTPAERATEPALIELAYARGLPLVATNEPFFATREDYEAHDALLCIAEGKLIADTDRRQLTPEHRFKTRAEMAALFADLPEALAATVEIAERCAFRPQKSRADPAALYRRPRRRCRRSGARRSCTAPPNQASIAGSPATASRPAIPPRPIASGSPSSSASSRA